MPMLHAVKQKVEKQLTLNIHPFLNHNARKLQDPSLVNVHIIPVDQSQHYGSNTLPLRLRDPYLQGLQTI